MHMCSVLPALPCPGTSRHGAVAPTQRGTTEPLCPQVVMLPLMSLEKNSSFVEELGNEGWGKDRGKMDVAVCKGRH